MFVWLVTPRIIDLLCGRFSCEKCLHENFKKFVWVSSSPDEIRCQDCHEIIYCDDNSCEADTATVVVGSYGRGRNTSCFVRHLNGYMKFVVKDEVDFLDMRLFLKNRHRMAQKEFRKRKGDHMD